MVSLPMSRRFAESTICPVCERRSSPASSINLCNECCIKAYRDASSLIQSVSTEQARQVLRDEYAEHASAVNPNPGSHRSTNRGYIYFLRQGGLVKIGFSTDPERRRGQLGGGDLLATIPGFPADERSLHNRFALLRMHGEWFAYTPALADYISQIAAEAA